MHLRIAFYTGLMAFVGCGGDDDGDDDAPPAIDAAVVVDAVSNAPDAPTGDPDASSSPDASPPDAGLPAVPAPIAYWSMDQADITTGVLADLIGDVDGTVNGPVQDATGQVGDALSFDGTDDIIDFGDTLDATFAGADNAFSVGMWLKPGAPGTARAVFGKTSDTACIPDEDGRQWFVSLAADNTVRFGYQTLAAGNAKVIASATALDTAGTWYHVVVTYDGSIDTAPEDRVAMYVDGVAESTTIVSLGAFPFDLVDVPSRLAAGVRVDSTGATCTETGSVFYLGSLDEVAVWDRVLTAGEAANAHTRGAAGARVVP